MTLTLQLQHAKGTKKHAKGIKLQGANSLTLLTHPLPLSPNFLLTSGMLLCSPTFSLSCSISLPGKGKETAATLGIRDKVFKTMQVQSNLKHFFQVVWE